MTNMVEDWPNFTNGLDCERLWTVHSRRDRFMCGSGGGADPPHAVTGLRSRAAVSPGLHQASRSFVAAMKRCARRSPAAI